ncbi:HipA family kinase [Amphritea sp. HPY]|uniref:HipA family kinase n=1 Tax=Amphritea sp. HPY TaxID=3421652 RepID=UPI003D7DFB62
MLEIEEILKRCDIKTGFLEPFICKANNSEKYYVKGANATGPGLIREWICANLAAAFRLPIPAHEILYLDPTMVRWVKHEWQDDLRYEHYFGSLSISPCDVISFIDVNHVPSPLQRDIFMFDYWIKHNDRQLSSSGGNPNILFDPNDNSIQIIDHNLAFANDFSVQDLLDYHVFAAKIKEKPIDMIDRALYEDRFAEALLHLDNCIKQIPDEWADHDPFLLAARIGAIKAQLLDYQHDKFWEALT